MDDSYGQGSATKDIQESAVQTPASGTRATAYFVLAFVLSWAFWIPFAIFAPLASSVLSGGGGSPVLLLQLLGNFGPSAAAIVLLALSGQRGELRSLLKRLLPHRASPMLYALVLFLPFVTLLPGLLYASLFADFSALALAGLLPALLTGLLISGPGEELGWRGYALPRLQAAHGPLAASLLIGVVWGVWHLPIWLWSSSSGGAAFVSEFALFVVGLCAFSVVFTWVYNHTGASMWMVVLLHAAVTASYNSLSVLLGPASVGTWVPSVLTTATACGAAVLVVALLGGRRDAAAYPARDPGSTDRRAHKRLPKSF
jgi:membrane protease YdiL (CAAX protease family)